MTLPLPSEDTEQTWLVEWLRLNHIPHFHIPNSTFTKSYKQQAKNKRLGVVKGVPDMFCIVNNQLIAIEMKRVKGGVATPEQKEWIRLLNQANIPARVCKGFDEAKKFIEEIQKNS